MGNQQTVPTDHGNRAAASASGSSSGAPSSRAKLPPVYDISNAFLSALAVRQTLLGGDNSTNSDAAAYLNELGDGHHITEVLQSDSDKFSGQVHLLCHAPTLNTVYVTLRESACLDDWVANLQGVADVSTYGCVHLGMCSAKTLNLFISKISRDVVALLCPLSGYILGVITL